MSRKVFFLILLCGLGLLMMGSGLSAQEMPARADLQAGWNWIEPGGDTMCSLGTPYGFAAREGASDNLLIYFQGGGACWNEGTCKLTPTFDPTVDSENPGDNPALGGFGIFDLENEDNPFADYDMVFIPYCTGDVHMGDNVVTYGEGDEAVDIHHNGFVNASAALDWTYANFDSPESVFVTGGSAGALGSIFHAPFIMQQYEGVRVTQLGDAAGGYYAPSGQLTTQFTEWGTVEILPDWVEAFHDLTPETLSFELLYIGAAQTYPDYLFSQYNAANDEVQVLFLSLVPDAGTLDVTLPAALAQISEAVPNFHYFTAGGAVHTILTRPEFYTYEAGGVRLVDWVSALAAGDAVENAACDLENGECAIAPGSEASSD